MVPRRVLPRSEFVLMFPGRDARRVPLCGQVDELASHGGANNSAPQMISEDGAHHASSGAGLFFVLVVRTSEVVQAGPQASENRRVPRF